MVVRLGQAKLFVALPFGITQRRAPLKKTAVEALFAWLVHYFYSSLFPEWVIENQSPNSRASLGSTIDMQSIELAPIS